MFNYVSEARKNEKYTKEDGTIENNHQHRKPGSNCATRSEEHTSELQSR